ncbi:aminopeptidase N C-terminal domain-containing protein [Sphingosinicella sp.]|uniref:aminopeptidase N C-terminal domain-containing protein n=1 Tax=Sphingosinicella sp. TaxID=1917971 RepID=UPI0035B280CC
MRRRSDYRLPASVGGHIDLTFDLDYEATRVSGRYSFDRRPGNVDEPLRLDFRDLDIRRFVVDGAEVMAPSNGSGTIDLFFRGPQMQVEVETALKPATNTSLQGLYRAGEMLVTHCEPEGFRRILPFPDRPDLAVTITTEIRADPLRFPALLSNGQPDGQGCLADGRHWVRWADPIPKPCYLFALAAGPFQSISDRHVTRSGREIVLAAYVQNGDPEHARFALESLKRVMHWEEDWIEREFDLDCYSLVMFKPFAFPAMENKGLNFFEESIGLVDPETAVDLDYLNVEINVAHEYLHNWTGNRVMCRDWFELGLKEGLTTLRHQLYAEHRYGRFMQLWPIRVWRSRQLPDDMAPGARPVRPEDYVEPFNLYNPTTYIKSAVIFRMIYALVGEEVFRDALDGFLTAFDGKSATIDDMLSHLSRTAGTPLDAFVQWFGLAGTPVLECSRAVTPDGDGRMIIRRSPTEGVSKRPIPLGIRCLDSSGASVPFQISGDISLHLNAPVIDGDRLIVDWQSTADVVPSLLRGLSAPVIVKEQLSETECVMLFEYEEDVYRRWEAGQQLATAITAAQIKGEKRVGQLSEAWASALSRILADEGIEGGLRAELLTPPDPRALMGRLTFPDPLALCAASKRVLRSVSQRLDGQLSALHERSQERARCGDDPTAIGDRMFSAAVLQLWLAGGGSPAREAAYRQVETGKTVNDLVLAFLLLCQAGEITGTDLLQKTAERWHGKPALMRRWFEGRALIPANDTAQHISGMLAGDEFDRQDMTLARTVYTALFVRNVRAFHAGSGAGYRLLCDVITALDHEQPELAAWLLRSSDFMNWFQFPEPYRSSMRASVMQLVEAPNVSEAVREILSRISGAAE